VAAAAAESPSASSRARCCGSPRPDALTIRGAHTARGAAHCAPLSTPSAGECVPRRPARLARGPRGSARTTRASRAARGRVPGLDPYGALRQSSVALQSSPSSPNPASSSSSSSSSSKSSSSSSSLPSPSSSSSSSSSSWPAGPPKTCRPAGNRPRGPTARAACAHARVRARLHVCVRVVRRRVCACASFNVRRLE
jgi:hypothetical protein